MDDPDRFTMTDADKAEYEQLLSIDGDGVMGMGYVEVPKINCSLPVYHGTDEAALQVAIGHLEGSSLPTGGERHPLCSVRTPGGCRAPGSLQIWMR